MSDSTARSTSSLTVEQYAKAKRAAQFDGMFAGLAAGMAGAVVGTRVFGFKRNMTTFAGLLTGVLSGYFFTQGFLKSNLAVLEEERRKKKIEEAIKRDFEGGAGGQEDLRDRYATTRGDH